MELRRALLSVADRRHLGTLVHGLQNLRVEVLATPGTAAACSDLGLQVQPLSALTGMTEDYDGRVLTQHPRVHAGILLRDDELAPLAQIGVFPIDLVVVNFGALPSVEANPRATLDDVLARVEVDGPSLVRAAAANVQRVAVLVDPDDYGPLLHFYMRDKDISIGIRRKLAHKAMMHVARYDAWLAEQLSWFEPDGKRRQHPASRAVLMDLVGAFPDGGDNPRQAAAFYGLHDAREGTLPQINLMTEDGPREPTWQEAHDGSRAMDLLGDLTLPSAVAMARGRALSTASADQLADAVRTAWAGVRRDARDVLLAMSHPVDEATAAEIKKVSAVCVLAPTYEALGALRGSGKKLLAFKSLLPRGRREEDLSPVLGGVLTQERDASGADDIDKSRIATKRPMEPTDRRAIELAWLVAKHTTSDAAVVARVDGGTARTVTVGASGASPQEAVEQALSSAGRAAAGAVLAVDVPIDSPRIIELAAQAGVTTVIHPGGHDDSALVLAADGMNLTLLSTGVTHRRS